MGSTINLTCIVRNLPEPSSIHWTHNGEVSCVYINMKHENKYKWEKRSENINFDFNFTQTTWKLRYCNINICNVLYIYQSQSEGKVYAFLTLRWGYMKLISGLPNNFSKWLCFSLCGICVWDKRQLKTFMETKTSILKSIKQKKKIQQKTMESNKKS